MGLFSFGGSSSRSRSNSRSNSSSFDNLDAFNFGRSDSSSRVAFEDVFARLFGGAEGAAGAVDTGALAGNANLLFGSGLDFLSGLDEGGAGAEFLEGELGRSGDLVNEQISNLSGDLGEFLNETILPSIKSSGVEAGNLGGSRGEVAKGIASEGLLEEFARGSTDIRLRERGRLTGIARDLDASETARSQIGLDSLPGLFGLAESSSLAGLSPFAALASILGPQTTLTDSSSFDTGSTTGRAGSRSASTSSSSSRSSSVNFGF